MNVRLSGAEIDRLAGDWLAREDGGELSAAERAELTAWLEAEERHLGAYVRLRAASARLNRLAALKSDQAAAEEAIEPASPRPVLNHRRGLIAAGMAAAAVLAGAGGYWAWQAPRTYRTDIGEMRRVTLRDGSMVALNTNSVLRVDYSGDRRELWLSRGEGHFIVAKDRTRPFVVHAAGASVTAVGTAFTVRAEARAPVRVTVTEGVISLEPPGRRGAKLVGAMQQAAVAGAGPQVRPVSAVEIQRTLAWTDGRIMLEGQTLGEAAAEFNRYNDRKLIVSGAAASAQVGGVFRTSEVETFARTAAPSLGLSMQVGNDGDIVLTTPG